MKIKPSGSGGARTHTHKYTYTLALTPSLAFAASLRLRLARFYRGHTRRRRKPGDKRVVRGVQSQYFQKASAEALKATGKVRFFIPRVVERVENMDSIKTRTDLFPSRAETAAKKFFLITPVLNNDF